jgi:hypothetical protein
MEYLIHEDKMEELNAIIGNQGSPATSKVSDSFAALEVAIKTGTKAEAQKAFDAAVQANILVGKAWTNAQQWHDKRINEDEYEGSTDGGGHGGGTDAPHFPPGTTMCELKPGQNGGFDLGTVKVNGGHFGAVIPTGDQWQYFVGDKDGDVASMSCDGVKIAFAISGSPADPGTPYNGNTAEQRPYKKGQFVCFRLGEGGYAAERAALFSIHKYA